MRTRAPLLCLLIAGCVWGAEVSAWELYEQGREQEKSGHMAKAYLLYSQAAAMDPKNQVYWLRSQAVKSRAALEAKIQPKIDLEAAAALTRGRVPEVQIPEATAKERADAAKVQPPAELKGEDGLHDFDLREDSQKLYQDVARTFGLDCVFDADYVPVPAFRFQLQGVDFRDALHGLELATGTFIVPLSSKLFLVAKDTAQKRTEQEPFASVSIPLPPTANQQEFNALITGVQQTMSITKVAFDTHNNTVIFRDRLSKILPALALLDDLSRPRPEVLIDMQFVEITRNDALTYGVDFPTLFTLTPLTNWLNNEVKLPSGVSGLLTFGGGKTLVGIGIMNASAVAKLTQATGKVMLNAQLRSLDNQQATMHIGDRYPVLTAGYYGNTGLGSTSTGTTIPNNNGNGSQTGTPNSGSGGGVLQLTQTTLNWTYNAGGSAPANSSITVTSTAGTIDYTATVVSSGSWLVVNSQVTSAGTLPATLTVAPGPTLGTLGTGTYLGTIQVRGSDGSLAYITVNLTVNNGSPNLTLSSNSIALASTAGGLVVQQSVSVTSTAGGALGLTVAGSGLTATASDITAAPNSPVTVTVYGNPAGLSALSYRGLLSVTVGTDTEEIPIIFTVSSGGSLVLSQSSVPWTYSTGGSLPQSTTVTVSSLSGSVSFTATAQSANNWLLVNGQTIVSGSLPGVLVVTPNSTLQSLSTGTYTGSVQIAGSDGSVAYLNVNLTVNGGTANGLSVSPNPVSLSSGYGGGAVQQTVTLTSATAGTLKVTVTGPGLSVSVPTTTVEADTAVTFTVTGNPNGLNSQNYIGSMTVSVGEVQQSVEVNFSVGAINSGTNGTTLYTPIPSFTFEDLGLTFKITPSIHSITDSTLDIEAEFKVLTGQSVDGVPVIANRSMKTRARVLNGEWAVVGGLLNTQEARNIAGLAGAGRIPGLGALFATRQKNQDKNEVIILIRPHLVSAPDQSAPHSYATGTDTRPRTLF